eukprot:gene4994-34778_t
MDWTEGGKTPYEVLEIENGPEATADKIKKVFRKLAVVKHPDKNRTNPNAAAEFAEIDKAYRILLDESARGALNDYLAAKAHRSKRDSQSSDKRRKLKEELEAREKRVYSERNEEDVARARLKVELERLRKSAEQEEMQHRQHAAQVTAAVNAARQGASSTPSDETMSQLHRTLKVQWDPESREYLPDELRDIFSVFGKVDDVILRDRKKKKHKASALVLMAEATAAGQAAVSVCGELSNPLLVNQLRPSVGEAEAYLAPWAEPTFRTSTSAAAASSALHPFSSQLFGGAGPLFKGLQAPAAPLFPSSSFPSAPASFSGGKPLFPMSDRGGAESTVGPASSADPIPAAASRASGSSSFPSGAFSSFKASSFPSGKAASSASSFEGAILDKMRREAERKKALADAQKEG